MIKLDLDGRFSTFEEDANRCIGLAIDAQGRVLATQSNDPVVGVLFPARTTLADSYGGQRLVRPNDLCVDRKGGVYFSDLIPDADTAFRPNPPGRRPALFYIRPGGQLVKVADMAAPNGVILSPDEKTLYAVNGDGVDRFDVATDGALRNRRPFAEFRFRDPDGFAIDSDGRLYVGVEGGIEIVAPSGETLGFIPVPNRVQSLAFGGADRRTLYAVSRGTVFRIRMLATGIRSRMK